MNLFKSSALLDQIALKYASLETENLRLLALSGDSDEAPKIRSKIQDLRTEIDEALLTAIRSTTSGLTVEEQARARKALWSRLLMALSGGTALVAPMLIMVLRPAKLTAVLTTSLCVLGVAVGLAIFMTDSHPKDVLACTAAYAAVLVVFVGAGGGT